MTALAKQVVPVKFLGLDTASDPKSAPFGRCDVLENTQTIRLTEGGFEIVKRPGTPSYARDIEGGGTLSAGAKLHEFGDELVATDGGLLYTWSPARLKWVSRGRCTSVAARVGLLDGTPANTSPYVDSAAFGNFTLTVIGRISSGSIRYYVRDATTGATVAAGAFNGEAPRLAVVGLSVFVFYHAVSDVTPNIGCRTISSSTPTTISAESTVCTNMHVFAGSGRVFDVIADTTNSRMVVGYRNTTPALTLMIWTTAMAAGTTVAYATEDPNTCLGFVKHDFSDGVGYVVVGTSANGVRLLPFGASSMTVTTNTPIDAATTNATAATGVFVTPLGPVHAFFEVPWSGSVRTNARIKGWNGTTLFEFCRSAGLASKAFRVNSKTYLLANHHGPTERSLFLLEWNGTAATSGDSGVSVAGFLLAGDGGGHMGGTTVGNGLANVLPGVIAVSATRFQIGCSRVLDPGVDTNHQFVAALADLTFDETQLGAPVVYNGLLHLPGAAAKVYDGTTVYEEGFYTSPEAPTLTAAAGGSLTLGLRSVLSRWVRRGRSGRIERSGPSAVATVTLSGGNQTISLTAPAYRITDSDERYNVNQELDDGNRALVNVEIYIADFGTDNYRLSTTLRNVATSDTVSTSITAEASTGELLDSESSNATPPAVLAFAVHRNRLVALSGADNAAWASKEAVDGEWSGFPIVNRVLFDTNDGVPVGLASDGTTLFIAKRSKVYALQGDGPAEDGSNPYSYPQPLPAEVGFAGPRAFASTPDGILFQSAKGFHMLDRAGGVQPIPGADSFDTLTVTGGVTLDDRPMALLATSDGRTLCWDWQNKIWHTWTGQAAVACCRWRNLFCWLGSDGKVHVETPGTYSDDAGAYVFAVEPTWFNLRHVRVYKGLLYADVLGTLTVSYVSSYDHDSTTAETAKTLAVTTSTKPPLVLIGARGRCNALKYRITETSTTAGIRLSSLELEVGIKPGAAKYAAGSYLR